MENKKYVQPWRILAALLEMVISFGLIIFYFVYWFIHDDLTKMQMFKHLWYVPVIAFVLLLLAKLQFEKFTKLNPKKGI
jgi:Zn-dependent protease